MASERQIAANRLNARKSTGPRSGAGRKRASRNAYRQGLTLNITSTVKVAKQLDKLARKIAGNTDDAITLECAGEIAQAELELARVRRAKVALIERASAFGELDPPQLTVTQMIRTLNALDRCGRHIVSKPIDASATMPSQQPERLAEAIRRVLPQLRKLDRYERRAAAQRQRAALELTDRIKLKHNLLVGSRCKTNPIFLNSSNNLNLTREIIEAAGSRRQAQSGVQA